MRNLIANERKKIGTCEHCGTENGIVEASGFYKAFVCLDCIRK